ncbi:LOW QUALITY PROTEIN: MAM and LDL-receptor class A domain-containing protein 1-like [Dermatophagoides pteronyssinus]|uniref:LOW QUALITY PROTEIN: MAM and LDL-receptor class A domain-containing protein 1-like n=1 Tax=Dermatophagoides pteronyssinus TaxID=6956 RepID=UPI003F67AF51
MKLCLILCSLLSVWPNFSESFHRYSSSLERSKRQEEAEKVGEPEVDSIVGQPCDYGTGAFINLCQWSVPNGSHPMYRWRIAQGSQQFWLGGPGNDHTLLDTSGGYAYFETSYQQQMNHNEKFISMNNQLNNQRQSNNSIISTGSLLGYSSKKSKNDEVIRPLISQFPLFQISKPESKKNIPVPDYGLLQTPNISETGPMGICMIFYYNIEGLSSDSLQVILSDSKTKHNRTLLEYSDVTDGEWRKAEVLYTYADLHQIFIRANARKLNDPDRLFRGYIAIDDPELKQLDPKKMKKDDDSCKGHCTFEASLCSWNNQDEDDDFDWKIGRGSQNLFTGPSRDFSSFDNNEISGGYIYIDSSYPRRPGDKAMLLSPVMNPTNDNKPLCLKFAIHMYGNGIGTLRVSIRYTSASEEQAIPDQVLWEMTGESGNSWHVAQVPISSPMLSYQIVFDGEIGSNNLGVIALDNIAFNEEECPVLPQTASKGNGDCTFDENMCLWSNPSQYNKVDDFDWLRQFSLGQTEPRYDHTKRSTDGYFINLNGDQPHRGGTRAWLYSPEFVPQSTVPKCMTFYYYMFERTIDSAGPSLGSLRIYVKTMTDMGEEINLVWRLNNHQGQRWRRGKVPILIGPDRQPPMQNYQIIIEGIWGDGRVGAIAVDDISFYNGNCTVYPPKAAAVYGECAFDHDLCGYRNQSGKAPTTNVIPGKAALERNKNPNRLSVSKDSITWKLATSTNRPANLQDHTFRAPIGYAYFDVFNQNQVQYPILRSPEFQPREEIPRCVSFWFTPFGRGDSTVLSVYVITMDQKEGTNALSEEGESEPAPAKPKPSPSNGQAGLETKTLVWRITTRKLDSVKPEWIYAQVSVTSELVFRIQFEGEAMDGGFALDDIAYYDGACRTRPIEAAVAPPPETGEAELRE